MKSSERFPSSEKWIEFRREQLNAVESDMD
jgi:hypothetical protein